MSNKLELLNRLKNGELLIGDGAMGTMMYQKGIFVNRCFEEINTTQPDIIEDIHRAYIDAGSDFIESNTFGANRIKLSKFGLGDQVNSLNLAGVKIAKKAAGDDILVAGAVGPTGLALTDQRTITHEDVYNAFQEQITSQVQAGVDFLLLETFLNPDELLLAVDAAASVSDTPVVAQLTNSAMSVENYSYNFIDGINKIASKDNVVAVGLNCSIGPTTMLKALKFIRTLTKKPVSVQPNAGLPQEVDGRTMYMCTPEYMSEYGKRFYEAGASIIGGCCGTTPEHIRQIALAVKSVSKADIKAVATIVNVESLKEEGFAPIPIENRSKLGAKLASGQKILSIEITPPRGTAIEAVIEKAKLCKEYGIDAVNIPDGPRASSRLSPLVTAVKIQQEADIETVLHVCCRDRNLIGMQSDMLGSHAIGLHNVLLITGDPPKLGEFPNATAVFDLDAVALTGVVRSLNHGLDVVGNKLNEPLSLTIGVGANPVASDMEREIERFKMKVKSGAEYAITQPVFDTESLFRFMDAVKDFSIPIIAGIWPFTSYKNAEFMANEVPGVVVPDILLERMKKATTREQGRQIGIEIAREMVAEIQDKVAGFAISAPFGNVKIALAVAGKISPDEI